MRKRNKISVTDKIIIYSGIGVAILSLLIIFLLLYSKSLSDDVKNSTLSLEEIARMTESHNEVENQTESASVEIGKTVEESKTEVQESEQNINKVAETVEPEKTIQKKEEKNEITADRVQEQEKVEEVKEKVFKFEKPVEGEITKEFAKDNLIFSDTLQEWTTHNGIDIKADKTSVVKAAEEGVIKSIKNDPRYGLTIVIEHDEHYKTVYSNLLTAEFIVEGEKVEKGQSVGTVGNTAVFEIADEPHLHFEILKDNIPQNPEFSID